MQSGVQVVGVLEVQDVGVLELQSAGQDVGGLEQQEEPSVMRVLNPQNVVELAPELLGAPLCPDSRPVTDSHQYAFLVNADTSAEAQDLELSIEEMLIRLDEFCAMMDMIRSETSLIIDDRIPAIECRVEEMSKIYCQVEKLEAFVKMVGHHVSYLEEELIRAERDHLSFPHTVKKMLAGDYLPTFLQKNSKPQSTYELPALYRTEDYFSASCKYKRTLD
ncbi:breast carcinoma-amplified sequence 4 isoform X3 [Phyllobates terribilis]|uniref:breast carcinoma-amplified sequence 4 isoform X3 n=1 Tax=Phyllobates terribilis TaxID=111132 RepID=UPI003CCB2126